MTPKDIDPNRLIVAVRKVATTLPNAIYDTGESGMCAYFNEDGTPGCIVGHGFAMLGIQKADLAEECNEDCSVETIFRGSTDGEAIGWLQRVQGLQDRGIPWAEAVVKADAGES